MRSTRQKIVLATAVIAVTLVTAARAAPTTSQADWPTWQKNVSGSRYNAAEHRITPKTVGGLKLKWAFTYAKVPFARTGAQPAVVGGVLYVGSPDAKFYALNAKTGAQKWVFDLTTVDGPVTAQNTNLVRDGAAVVGDRVYFGDSRGRIFALDKHTGRLLWSSRPDPHPAALLTGSPLVVGGRVYIGISSSEAGLAANPSYPCCTFRGQLDALDASTGHVIWQRYTMPPATRVGSWPSGAAEYAPSGGAIWDSPVLDPRTGTLYVGTGNNYTGAEGEIDSLLAVDARTGALRWQYRMTFPDTYTQACANPNPGAYCPGLGKGTALDFDLGATANIFRVHGRTLIGIGQKGGMYRAFDARTGRLVWKNELAVPDLTGQDPGDSGVQWGSSYDGKRLYVATWRAGPGTLFALDPATGAVVWKTPHPADGCTTGGAGANPQLCALAFTPAVSTTPGLVYEGSYTGKMYIFSSANGKLLWQYDAVRDFQGVNGIPGRGIAISGNGGAVIVNGMMYVQAGYYPYYPSDKGYVLLAFGL